MSSQHDVAKRLDELEHRLAASLERIAKLETMLAKSPRFKLGDELQASGEVMAADTISARALHIKDRNGTVRIKLFADVSDAGTGPYYIQAFEENGDCTFQLRSADLIFFDYPGGRQVGCFSCGRSNSGARDGYVNVRDANGRISASLP
jgi:hypothetical protein